MKVAFFAFLAFLGSAIFLVALVADRQIKLGEDWVSKINKVPRSVIEADLNLKLVSDRNPYMPDTGAYLRP